MRLALSALVLLLALASTTASAQTSPAPDHGAELGAGIGLVALGVIGGAFTGLAFLGSEIRHAPAGCPGPGCPYDPPVVGYDPGLVVLGATLGVLSITSIVVGALVFIVPALAHDQPLPLSLMLSPSGAHASLTLRW